MDRNEIAKKWLAKLTRLNPASGRKEGQGKAPHKPLLLLSLIDTAEIGELFSRSFTLSPELALRFRIYGSIVSERWPTRLDVSLPFFHLSSQHFWSAFDGHMKPARSPKSCSVCDLHPEFFDLLGMPRFRSEARFVLIEKYFLPNEQTALFEVLGIEHEVHQDSVGERGFGDAIELARTKGRCARFAVRVCSEYRFTCALTGYRCVTGYGSAIVDAAHIEPWAKAQNDDPQNGLALSKSAHWMFDEGLWTVDDDFRILVNSRRFTEQGPDFMRLASFAGRHLQFDPASRLRPSLTYLRRHRMNLGTT